MKSGYYHELGLESHTRALLPGGEGKERNLCGRHLGGALSCNTARELRRVNTSLMIQDRSFIV